MHRIIGVDPGKLTGICSFTVSNEEQLPCLVEHFELNHMGVGQFFENILRVRNPHHETIVACENFRYDPKKPSTWSLETIGLVRYFCDLGEINMYMQDPHGAKALVPDDVLHRAGLYFTGKGHACDAARHALYFELIKKKLMHWTLKGA
jgi:hypothetical protein